MSYGFVITEMGKNLLAKLGTGEQLKITRIMVGKGEIAEGQNPAYFTDLVQPVAQATSTLPLVKENTLSFIVEYRNDLNGGLEEGFWLKEFGVFAQDGENEILLYYATLGDFPQYVQAYINGVVNIKRYPVTIAVSDKTEVVVSYNALAFVTEERMKEFSETDTIPYLEGVLEETENKIQQKLDEKANVMHEHSADEITSGILPVARGGTGATTAADARTNLGAAASSHTHNYAGSSSAGGAATSAVKLQTARTMEGVNFDGTGNITHFGVCETAADVAAKVVTVPHFSYVDGARILVLFTKGTTLKQSTTLNVNNLGAKNIIGAYNRWPTNIIFEAGNIIELVYYKGLFIITTANAISLAKIRTIDGMNFDGSANITHFGVCNTAANVAEKTVTLSGFVLAQGARVAVYFAYENTTASPMLNINGTGAHFLAYRNGSYAVNGQWGSGDIVEFVYYNNHWIMLTANARRLTTARSIRTNLGSTSASNFDGTANITPGVTGTLPIANGGTGATTASAARTALGAFSSSGGTISGDVKINGNILENVPSALKASNDYHSVTNLIMNGFNNVYVPTIYCSTLVTDINISTKTITTSNNTYFSDIKSSSFVYLVSCEPNIKRTKLTISSVSESTKQIVVTTDLSAYNNFIRSQFAYIIYKRSSNSATGASIVSGAANTCIGNTCAVFGNSSFIRGDYIFASGNNLIGRYDYQNIIGKFNKSYTGKFIVGKGNDSENRANCFRVTDTAVYATGDYNSTGADYAEYFQWGDGNPNNEDRRGLFVTLYKDKIHLATPTDNYILGIISGNPSIIGDSHEDQWNDMFLRDIYGSPIMEKVEIPEKRELKEVLKEPVFDEDGNEIEQEKEYEEVIVEEAHTEIRQKLNPDYDPTQKYIPRSERPEWAVVGMMGKLVVIDDGSCEENGWCTAGEGGIAVKSETQTKFRVMKRLDKNHVKVLVL